MTEIVKVDVVPTVAKPVEGVHYNIIEGAAGQGDKVRIRSSVGEHFQSCYTPPQDAPAPPQFRTLTGSGFIALLTGVLGIARVDQLLAKSKTIETLLVKSVTVDRMTGNTPAAIAFLKTGANALTVEELAGIDAAWEELS